MTRHRDEEGNRLEPRTRMRKSTTAPVPNLLAYRTRRTLTQEDLAKMIGSNNSAVSMWETGYHDPSFRIIRRLAAALQVTPEDLRFGTPNFEEDAPSQSAEEAR